jgi:hypothetical protein
MLLALETNPPPPDADVLVEAVELLFELLPQAAKPKTVRPTSNHPDKPRHPVMTVT